MALRSSLTASGVRPVPSSISLRTSALVGLKDGHRVEGHACLTGRDVGLPDKGGSCPTWLSRKEGGGTSKKAPKRVKGGRPKCPLPQAWRCNPAPHNPRLVKSAATALVSGEGKNGCLRDLEISLMQIAENSSFLRSAGIRAAKEPFVEFQRLRSSNPARASQ